MAWDLTQPTNTTKIRNLGVVIRPNWQAIETADSTFQPDALNLTDRDAASLSSDPTAISTAVITYCKKDPNGNPELFSIDPSSNVVQLTRGAVNAAATGHTVLPGGMILNWGSGTGTTANVVFDRAFTSALYSITISNFNTNPATTATVSATSLTGATLKSTNVNAIYYMAIGY